MSAAPEVLARLDAWLSGDRIVEDRLAQLRDLVCDLVNAGEDLRWHEMERRSFSEAAEGWSSVSANALEAFETLAGDITDALGRDR